MEPFKDFLGFEAATKIALATEAAASFFGSEFSPQVFLKNLEAELRPLELKQRMHLLTARLAEQLPKGPEDFPVLVKALKKSDQDQQGLSGFLVWPLTHYVSTYGLESPEESLAALKEMTKVFTSEFAVRPFLREHQDLTLKIFESWVNDESEHVRRLVSEGTRPYLPWGEKLRAFSKDPEITWPLLEALSKDDSKYVQKSVANHLNDHSKLHAKWLVHRLKSWPNLWVQKQALRTLIKKGDLGALKLIGVSSVQPKMSFALKKKKIRLGETLVVQVDLQNVLGQQMKVLIDVEIGFLKKNGVHSPKVFKGKTLNLSAKQKTSVELKIPLKKVTTRVYYRGNQTVCLILNGKKTNPIEFHLSL